MLPPRSVFPSEPILRNQRSSHGIVGAKGMHLEIDVYMPNLKLAFEYQVCRPKCETSYLYLWYGCRILITSLKLVYLAVTRCLNIFFFSVAHFPEKLASSKILLIKCIYKERDNLKLAQAENNGITLIYVPFWWPGDVERYGSVLCWCWRFTVYGLPFWVLGSVIGFLF